MSRPDPAAPAAAGAPASGPASTTAAAARVSAPRGTSARGAPTAADPPAAPSRPTLVAAAVYAVATLLLGWQALLGRFLVSSTSDQFIAGYAFREFQASYMAQTGGFPLWNPYLFAGLPYVAGMHGDIFYPTFLLRLLLPPDAGMTWGMILHVFLAGLFAYQFLRTVGIGFWGALIGGLAYLMGGNVAGLVSPGHDGKIFISALLPLVLLLTHRAVRDGRLWAWGALAIAITLAVLTPHPQLLQYLLLLAGAYALFAALSADPATGVALPRPLAVRRLALAAVAVGAGLLGGAIQFWPVLEYTDWSPRAGGKGWEHAISYSMPPEELLNTYLPQFSGVLESYTGRNGIHFHSEYIGAAVLVLAGLGIGALARHRRFGWFWLGALVVSTLWALGGFTPFYHLVYALVPGTKFFRAPSTMLYIVSFCTAVLAALGTEKALTLRARPRYLYAWLGFAVLMALLATGGMLTNLAASFANPGDPRVDANQGALTLGAWRSLLAVGAVAGVLLAVLRGRLQPRAAGWALAGVIALDLWSVERLYWRFSPPAAELYAGDAVVDFLRARTDSGRVIPLALAPLAGTSRDPYFGSGDGRGGAFMTHRIRSAVGYHGNEIGRYQQLSGWESEEYVQRLGNPNFWRLANVRYLYTNSPQPPIEGAQLVAGPVRNVAGNMVYLYQLPGENPPAWVTTLAVKADDPSVLATVLDPRFDLRTVALFDPAAAVQAQAVPSQQPAPTELPLTVKSFGPGRIALSLSAPAPAGAALVVSENYYPGWQATVDGRDAPVGRADYSLIGVQLPTGGREVELTFTSPRYERGKAITLLILALSVTAIAAGLVLERRGRA